MSAGLGDGAHDIELALSDKETEGHKDLPKRGAGMAGFIVCAGKFPFRLPNKLWMLIWSEFERNGRQMLSPGKIRFLRRKARKFKRVTHNAEIVRLDAAGGKHERMES